MDILLDILDIVLEKNPKSSFVANIRDFYIAKGGLSKKQMEGLYAKAQKIDGIAPGKLATLEAIIKKKATKYKSDKPLPVQHIVDTETEALRDLITSILDKYPQHRQVLFLQAKQQNRELITQAEKQDLKRIAKSLL